MLYFVSECSAEYPCISWVTIAMSRHKENYPNKQKEGQMTSRDKTRGRAEWISFQSLLLSVAHLDSCLPWAPSIDASGTPIALSANSAAPQAPIVHLNKSTVLGASCGHVENTSSSQWGPGDCFLLPSKNEVFKRS